MYGKERLQLTDTTIDALHKVSEGNPGALTVCMGLMKDGAAIDPDAFMGGMGFVLSLDTHGIYGSRIWMLFKDVCGESIGNVCALLRAVQLGFFSDANLDAMIDGHYKGDDTIDGLISQVQESLPKFNIEATA